MVHSLQLEPSVKEICEPVAADVDAGQELQHEPAGVRVPQPKLGQLCVVEGLHGEVRDADLYVEDAYGSVGQQQQSHHPGEPLLQLDHSQDENLPGPEAKQTGQVQLFLLAVSADVEQKDERLSLHVEARKTHDRDECLVLHLEYHLGGSIQGLADFIVGGLVSTEDLGRDCEERQVLDVRVSFDTIRNDVVSVVVVFPPSPRYAE